MVGLRRGWLVAQPAARCARPLNTAEPRKAKPQPATSLACLFPPALHRARQRPACDACTAQPALSGRAAQVILPCMLTRHQHDHGLHAITHHPLPAQPRVAPRLVAVPARAAGWG